MNPHDFYIYPELSEEDMQKGSDHYNWKGGKIVNSHGYTLIHAPGHNRAHKQRSYVYEQILLAEKALGGPLPLCAQVHHHSPTQLVVCQDDAYHKLLHQRTRAYNATGHPTWLRCEYCKQYSNPKEMYIRKDRPSGWHLECRNKYRRNQNASNKIHKQQG